MIQLPSSTAGQRAAAALGGNAMGVQGRLFNFQHTGGSGRFSDRSHTAGPSSQMVGLAGVKLASEAAAAAAVASLQSMLHADGEGEGGAERGGAGGGGGGGGGGVGGNATASDKAPGASSSAGGTYPYVISRSQEEKFANPDRLVLDRRKLTQCPFLEGEDRLRLLNYQNNLITKIENLGNLPNLIFLDLYNNQVKTMDNLDQVPTLRVIMLGKNLVDRISGIHTLTRLDVLDLHGNQISKIEPFGHLAQLRVLNLAGNLLTSIDNLDGMPMLTELNVRRNRVAEVQSLEGFTCLERLFVSSNCLATFESLNPIFRSHSLVELALDGNSVASETNYRQVVIERAKTLRHLDLRRVTEEERRLASLQAKKEEERMHVAMRLEVQAEERLEGIRRARGEFEEAVKAGDAKTIGRGIVDVTGVAGVDMHMHIYGSAVDQLDRQATGVVSVCFQYVLWSDIGPMLSNLSFSPGLKKMEFSHNGIESLVQVGISAPPNISSSRDGGISAPPPPAPRGPPFARSLILNACRRLSLSSGVLRPCRVVSCVLGRPPSCPHPHSCRPLTSPSSPAAQLSWAGALCACHLGPGQPGVHLPPHTPLHRLPHGVERKKRQRSRRCRLGDPQRNCHLWACDLDDCEADHHVQAKWDGEAGSLCRPARLSHTLQHCKHPLSLHPLARCRKARRLVAERLWVDSGRVGRRGVRRQRGDRGAAQRVGRGASSLCRFDPLRDRRLRRRGGPVRRRGYKF